MFKNSISDLLYHRHLLKRRPFFPPMCLCNVQAYWSLQQSADLAERGLDTAGPACAQVHGQREWGDGEGQPAKEGDSTHPPVRLLPRGPRWDTSQLSLLPLLKGWEEPWQWDFSGTATWTQVRPHTRRLQLSPWRHLQSKKTLCWLSAQGGLQPFRKEKLSIEVNPLLLVLSFQELDSQICLVFSGFFGPSSQSPTVTLEEGELCVALSPPAPALMMPCRP